jgi:hypothetical protein
MPYTITISNKFWQFGQLVHSTLEDSPTLKVPEMTFAFLRNTTAFTVALIGAALVGGTAPASGATITYSDPACAAFTITGSNGNYTLVCSGGGGGVPPGAPTGCSIAPVSALPAGGGLVNLSASCSGGDPVTNYHWTATGSPSGLNADTSTGTNSATISATTSFTVVASNASGPASPATTSVQVGGVIGGISCAAQGFNRTMSYSWNWATGNQFVQTYNDGQGPLGANGMIVIAFTPTADVTDGNITISEYPGGIGTTRAVVISTQPCDIGGGSAATVQYGAKFGYNIGNAFTVAPKSLRGVAKLTAGTQYYINIANRDSTGVGTCISQCEVRVNATHQ